MIGPLKIGDGPRVCTECCETRPSLHFSIDLNGTYSEVCRYCTKTIRSQRPPRNRDVTQVVSWARGSRANVRLDPIQIDRIVLIGAIEGYSPELIQETLTEANEALLAGRQVIL